MTTPPNKWQKLFATAETMVEATCQPFTELSVDVEPSFVQPLTQMASTFFANAKSVLTQMALTECPLTELEKRVENWFNTP